ncbi:signal peptidase I [Nocardioidaceae bacterium SCSIO 66511]|nr:signal peptidase I [Nocardioidaceae bacterium SCSIO 66511]
MNSFPRPARLAREAALTLGAFAGIVCIVLALMPAFGIRPLVVTSGSMEPDIATGALAFTHGVGAGDLRVGDVVSVRDESGVRVTHRIESMRGNDGLAQLTLRGDANAVADARAYEVSRADRVLFSVDGLGYALGWLRTPLGIVVASAIAISLLWLAFRDGADNTRTQRSAGRRGVASAAAIAVVAVAAAGAYEFASAEPTRAAWTDQASARTGQFDAATVLPPTTAPECTNQGGLLGLLGYAQLTWPHRDAAYSYAYTITRVSNGQVVGGGSVSASGGVGSTVTLDVRTALLGNNLLENTDYDVTVRSVLNASGGWQSTGRWTTRVHSANLLVGLSMRCGPGGVNRIVSSTTDSPAATTNLER